MELAIHTYLKSGKYRIYRLLGQGGFAYTYKAVDTETGKDYAIKELFPNIFCARNSDSNDVICTTIANNDIFNKIKARFLKEVKNLSELHHNNIIKVYDVFEENNTIYYVMELIKGKSLEELVRENGPLSIEQTKEYIYLICDALGYIHSKHMTHLDIKPGNILIQQSNDMPILIDFGLSKHYDASGGATSTLLNAYSQGFSPIEQYNPDDLMSFSPSSDIYSLSATLFFMLTGVTPPPSTQLAYNPLDLSEYNFPLNIKRTIKKGMALRRNERFQDVSEFLHSLNNTTSGDNTTVTGKTATDSQPINNGHKNSSETNNNTTKIIGNNSNDGSTQEPERKPLYKKTSMWVALSVVASFLFFKFIGNDTEGHTQPVANDSDTIKSAQIELDSTILHGINDSENIDNELNLPSTNNISLSAGRNLSINGPSYNATFNMNVSNGKLTCNQTINGERANYSVQCNTSVSAEKILDQAEGYYYYCAATEMADNIVNEYGTYSEPYMDATLKFLKLSMNALSTSRGGSSVAYNDVKHRYDMLKEIKNNPTENNLSDVEIIAWGMGEHPISPKNVSFQ